MFLEILARRKTKSLTLQHKKIKKNKKTKPSTYSLFVLENYVYHLSIVYILSQKELFLHVTRLYQQLM